MLERKKIWLSVLAAAIAVFFYSKGEKVTATLGAITAGVSALSLERWVMIIGILFTIASFVLSWIYKQKYLEALRSNGGKSMIEDDIT